MSQSSKRLLGIESLRGGAALYVFIGHLILSTFPDQRNLLLPFRFGGEAVILFFVISGFTVTYSTMLTEDQSSKNYFYKRFSRIYPIFFLALFVSFIYVVPFPSRFFDLFANILMLQEYGQSRFGVVADTYGNPALWSLSYEWWFYVQFWIYHKFVPQKIQTQVVAISATVALFAYYFFRFQPFLFVGMLPIWWIGAMFARRYLTDSDRPSPPIWDIAVLILPILVCGSAAAYFMASGPLSTSHSPVLELRQFVVAAVIGCLTVAAGWRRIEILGRLKILSGFFAKNSYAIYALHFPIILALFGVVEGSLLRFIFVVPTVIIVAWLAETFFQPFVAKILKKLVWC